MFLQVRGQGLGFEARGPGPTLNQPCDQGKSLSLSRPQFTYRVEWG